MTKRLHTRTKIFFKNPYVVRVQYDSNMLDSDVEKRYRTLCRRAYKEIKGTWGYSNLEYEQQRGPSPSSVVQTVPGFNGANLVIQHLFDDYNFVQRGYFVFKDEMDALQFRLSIDTSSLSVKIWPERWFTIHELIEDEE